MQYLFLIVVALLLAVVLAARWLATANPATVSQVVRGVGMLLLAAVVVFVVARGGANLLFFLAPVLLPVLLGMRSARNRLKSAAGPSPGGGSDVQTDHLRMHLDHDSGEMTGEVIAGRHQGRHLRDLDLDELLDLWRSYSRDDPQSATVLEAYLDRHHGEVWRDRAETGTGGGEQAASGPMSEDEAYRILGLQPGASQEAIRDAHRRLMQKLHPDRGGSDYLAAKINQAKDRLMGA